MAGLFDVSLKQEDAANDQTLASRANARICADQLVQLAMHGRASDEVILAALCLLLTLSFFQSSDGSVESRATFSLGAFRKTVGFEVAAGDDDLLIPAITPEALKAGDDGGASAIGLTHWRSKLEWALKSLMHRPAPETIEKHTNASAALGGSGVETESSAPVLRTLAFHGCLSDGSLWIMRLHEWWEHIAATPPQLPGIASPRNPRDRRRAPRKNGARKLRACALRRALLKKM